MRKKMKKMDINLDQTVFTLAPEHFDAFVAVLNAPPPPNAKLKALFAKQAPWDSVANAL